jgi:hypothetical protein
MNEFERRCELLSTAFGLKGTEDFVLIKEEGKKNYGLLFSTYIQMIEQDQNNFFIDGTKKKKIIDSLKNTLSLSQTDSIREFTKQLNNLKTDDPHSFILLPASHEIDTESHSSGVIIYKNKQKDYLVAIIDKYRTPFVAYRTISKSKSMNIGSIFLEAREHFFEKDYRWILTKLDDLSNEKEKEIVTELNLTMQKLYVGNCSVKNIEAALKVALFNCRKNIFDLSQEPDSLTPKWHPDPGSTLEMRKRFLNAIKVPRHPEWNQGFEKIFEHYHARKMVTMQDLKQQTNSKWAFVKKNKFPKKIALAEKHAEIFADDKSFQSLKNNLTKQMQERSTANSPENKNTWRLAKESRCHIL